MTYSGEFRRQASWREYQERINIDSKQPKLEEQTVGGGVSCLTVCRRGLRDLLGSTGSFNNTGSMSAARKPFTLKLLIGERAIQNCHSRVVAFQRFKQAPFAEAGRVPRPLGGHVLSHPAELPPNPRSPLCLLIDFGSNIQRRLVRASDETEVYGVHIYTGALSSVDAALVTKQSCVIYRKIYYQNE